MLIAPLWIIYPVPIKIAPLLSTIWKISDSDIMCTNVWGLRLGRCLIVKFIFSKKATKIDEIFTVDLTLCSKCQIDGEDFVDFCGPPRKHEF